MFNKEQHHVNSSLRENIVEHLFIGAALRLLWQNGIVNVEILKSEFDAYGYDLVVTSGKLVRHVQLKTGTKLKIVSVSKLLSEKPSGCVLYIEVSDRLDLGPFYFFSSNAGDPLPDISEFKIAKRATANSEGLKPSRSNHRDVPVSKFQKFQTLAQAISYLLNIELRLPHQTIPLSQVNKGKKQRHLSERSKELLTLPKFDTDDDAEKFVETADLSKYDLSAFKPFTFLLSKNR